VAGYAEVATALLDRRLSARRPCPNGSWVGDELPKEAWAISDAVAAWLLRLDPPEHTRIRGVLAQAFTAQSIAALGLPVQGIVDWLLDVVASSGGMEAITQLASPLSATVIMDLIGLPRDHHDQFRRCSDAIGAFAERGPGSGREKQGYDALLAASAYLHNLINERRCQPADDLLSRLIHARTDPPLTEGEIVGISALLLLAGHQPTAYALAHALHTLLHHPDQLEDLRAEPGLMRRAVEELLRYDSPIQGVLRLAVEDTEFGGRHIRRGQVVLLWLGAANRDPARFADPDRLDLTRSPNSHASFGYGIHRCPGARLARLLVGTALTTVLRRLPDLRLAAEMTEWQGNVLFRILRSLPVAF
jgi:cytochrome P450